MDDINRFWIPIAQILPVFILGLVIEARAALSPSESNRKSKSAKREDVGFKDAWDAIDSALRVIYALLYVLAMVLLLLAFVLSVLVLAGATIKTADIGPVLIIAVGGAILTGLLPVARLLEDHFLDLLAGLVVSFREWRKEKRAAIPKDDGPSSSSTR